MYGHLPLMTTGAAVPTPFEQILGGHGLRQQPTGLPPPFPLAH